MKKRTGCPGKYEIPRLVCRRAGRRALRRIHIQQFRFRQDPCGIQRRALRRLPFQSGTFIGGSGRFRENGHEPERLLYLRQLLAWFGRCPLSCSGTRNGRLGLRRSEKQCDDATLRFAAQCRCAWFFPVHPSKPVERGGVAPAGSRWHESLPVHP